MRSYSHLSEDKRQIGVSRAAGRSDRGHARALCRAKAASPGAASGTRSPRRLLPPHRRR